MYFCPSYIFFPKRHIFDLNSYFNRNPLRIVYYLASDYFFDIVIAEHNIIIIIEIV